jgi:subtilisin family serine protease
MRQKKFLFASAAVLLLLLLVVPQVQLAGAKGDPTGKMSAELVKQLSAAKPDETVTAVVKMSAVANLNGVQGVRGPVFAELRRTASMSQVGLVNYLNAPTVQNRVSMVRPFWIDNIVLVKATKDVILELAARDDVQEVFDNFTLTLPPRPEKTAGPEPSPMQVPLWDSLTKIGAPQVWTTYGIAGAGVRVGGLDTGVDITHPDIAGKMITNNPADPTYPGGWAEFDANGNIVAGSVPHDSDQHGTHTTGTMIGGNASGYHIGVAPDANLIHGLVIPGGSGTFTQVVGGMEWIIDPDNNPLTDDGAQVVNMSLGATGVYTEMVAPTDNMVAAGVFPSFSIGNSGPNPSTSGSPGNVPSAFGVGATDLNDVIASFSSRGPVTWNFPPYVGTYTKPDISAPGVDIFSSIPGGSWAGDWSGTSMAAPHVAGTVALMLQANPSLTVDMIKQLLAQTALELGDPGMDNNYGWGRVNAFAAVSAALVGVGTLNGTVYSSGGGTVDHVLVRVVDTGQRVYTNALGQYTMQLVAGDHTIEYSKFGYQTSTVAVTMVADVTTTQDVTLTQLPSGTIAGFVTDNDTHLGVAAAITVRFGGSDVAWTSSDPLSGAYSIVLPVGTYDLVFSPGFPYPLTVRNNVQVLQGMTTTLDVALMGAQVLVVDDDAGKAYQTYYEQAVMAAGRSYITVTTPPTAAEMAMFESVVWLTGDDYTTTLSSADQLELAAYLDGGGRLFMSGQDIGYDINTAPFYADYLHADYVQDDVKLGGVVGDAANPVGQGFTFNIKGGGGANNQTYPSEIDPLSPAQTAFAYDPLVPEATGTVYKMGAGEVGANGITSSGTAGLTVDQGAYKIVYFAFGFEAIDNAAARGAVMSRILDWLQGYPEIAHTPLGDTEDTENPYEVKALITSDYFTLNPSTFAVVYDMGGPSFTVPMVATGAPDEYAGSIPAQPIDTQVNYYITASDMVGHTTTDPLGAPATKHTFWVKRDTTPPAVVHQPHRNTNDLEGPYTICAMVTDNIGVESVHLMYAKNGGLVHRAKMMPMGGDQYCGAIPGPSMVGDYYEYYIYAMDESYSGNVTRMPETGRYRFEIVEEFVWDFEPDDGGFVQTGDVWQWGAPTSGPGAAHSGVNLWGTILAGNYPNSANAKLDIPAVTLAASKPYVIFSFWHWYRTEASYDGGNIKVSSDGGATWAIVEPFGGYDGTASTANAGIPGERCFIGANNEFWQQELFDLSAYAGQTVMIRFHFGSDGSVNYPGWYVDDVRLRSTDVDDVPPVITGVQAPVSTFDTVGPYAVSCYVTDPLSGVGTVSALYSTDNGMTFTEIAMAPGVNPNQWVASIPGLPAGTRAKLYIRATDTASVPNVTVSPAGAPVATYGFSILPSAPILVVQMTTTATSLAMFRDALEANGHAADYWDRTAQGWLDASKLQLYKTVILDETSGLDANEQADLTTFLNSGTAGMRKQFFILGRDLMFSSTTRPWIEQYMRAAYVQDDPAWRQITGEPGDPIGAEETFTISGSYPDELQRSTTYPGGEIVYRYTGPGTASSETRDELAGAYEKDGKEWDGVMPHAPISLDAAAAMKYAGEKYRSVYFAFNLFYVLEPQRRADIAHRVLAWLSAPEIVHTALKDTENASSPYVAVARIYSETLDASRLKLTYNIGGGPVLVTMTPTGNPNEFSAAIPAQPYGTTVHYYLSAANLDGTTSYHPKGAPTEQHTFVVNADMVPPEIVHTPYSNTTDVVGPYAITATITDNIAVDPSGVFLTYNKNSGTNTTIPMVALGGDAYGADIPGPAVLGDVFNYSIRARDTAAVPNEARDPTVGSHTFEIVDYYAWDFEANNGGFTTVGSDWEWGDPTSGPMDAHSGVNVWATKLATTYSASSNSKLHLPPVTVPSSHTYALFSFWQWYAIETNYDGGNVKISTNGGATWTILTPDIGYNGTALSGNAGIPGEKCFTGTTTGNFWRKVTFNLTAYKGQTVLLRLHFGSDSSVQYPGWYVDDVRIESVEDTAGPVFVSTTPPASTFDTVGPYTAKTVVADALSGVSAVTLYYSTNSGASWTTVAMAPTANPNEYSGGIPGQPLRTRIRLYVQATDNATNTSKDPATAPAAWYEFGIMPSGDYLVLRIGSSSTPAQTFIDAFTAMGRTADIWSVDTSGMPSLAILQAYLAVIVDNATSFSTAQMTALSAFLDASVGHKNRIILLGRDLQYYSGDRAFMEKYTGTVYVKDDPGFRRLRSMPGDPIGAGETFVISGSYPDEVKLSTTYPGASIVYKYSALSASGIDYFDTEQAAKEFFEKEGKGWDPKLWPFAPSGPDSIAASRYVGTTYASVYFTFNFNYIQEAARRAGILQRGLDWLGTTSLIGEDVALQQSTPLVPDALVLGQNYPNPFNPVTRIQIGIPASYAGRVELKVYNVQGQLVKTVFEGTKPAGFHTFEWDGTSNYGTPVSSGIYFARCQAGQSVLTRKMVLLK